MTWSLMAFAMSKFLEKETKYDITKNVVIKLKCREYLSLLREKSLHIMQLL
jgi:hypothetical protein